MARQLDNSFRVRVVVIYDEASVHRVALLG